MEPQTISDEKVEEILKKFNHDPSHLIGILQEVEVEVNYLPKNALHKISETLGIPLTQIYHVATFFRAFSLEPRGKHKIHVCTGTACHVRGSRLILEELERQLECKNGHTTKDYRFSIETVNCVGACAIGPVLVIDNEYHGNIQASTVKNVLKKYSD